MASLLEKAQQIETVKGGVKRTITDDQFSEFLELAIEWSKGAVTTSQARKAFKEAGLSGGSVADYTLMKTLAIAVKKGALIPNPRYR